MRRGRSIEYHGGARHLWRDLLELLKPLATHRLFKITEPSSVAARPGQRANEAATNRIRNLYKDNRSMCVRLLQRRDSKIALSEDHVRFQICQVLGKDAKLRGVTSRPAGGDLHFLSIRPP